MVVLPLREIALGIPALLAASQFGCTSLVKESVLIKHVKTEYSTSLKVLDRIDNPQSYVSKQVLPACFRAIDPTNGSAVNRDTDSPVLLVYFSSKTNLYKQYGCDYVLLLGAFDCASGVGLGAHPVVFEAPPAGKEHLYYFILPMDDVLSSRTKTGCSEIFAIGFASSSITNVMKFNVPLD